MPYEQNTQQSPAFGRSSSPQFGQSKKKMQASVGIFSVSRDPQCGHVSVLCKMTVGVVIEQSFSKVQTWQHERKCRSQREREHRDGV